MALVLMLNVVYSSAAQANLEYYPDDLQIVFTAGDFFPIIWRRNQAYGGDFAVNVNSTSGVYACSTVCPQAALNAGAVYYKQFQRSGRGTVTIYYDGASNIVGVGGDFDSDGFGDSNDTCPRTPAGEPINSNGCSAPGNLIVNQQVTSTDIDIGDQLTYFVTVNNQGAGVSQNVVLTTTLPDNFQYTNSSLYFLTGSDTPNGSCAYTAGVLTCTIASIPSGRTVGLGIHGTVTDFGSLTNVINVTAPNYGSGGGSINADNTWVDANDIIDPNFSAPTNNPHALTSGVGAIPGDFYVNQSGKANYAISLRMPPSNRDLAPQLAFSYTGGINDGNLGVAWYLSGLSEITHCSTILERDNYIDGANYNDSDKFCLNGQQLIAVNGSYGANNTEYRTESETFAKIVSYGGSGNNPDYFRVWHASGEIETYGNTGSSVKATRDGNLNAIWKIAKKEDREGNDVDYQYTANSAQGEHYIDTINYADGSTQVKFVYETRPDITSSYRDSHFTQYTQRIDRVEFSIDNAKIREYRLEYQTGTETGKSQLKSVQDCPIQGGTAYCLPATEFEWGAFANIVRFTSQGQNVDSSRYPTGVNFSDQKYHIADVNADGRDDIIWTYRNVNRLGRVLYLANASGTGFVFSSVDEETQFSASNTPDTQQEYFTADVNADGRIDLIYVARYLDEVYRTIYLANSTGTAFIDQGYQVDRDVAYQNIDLAEFRVGDVNGDGRADLVWLYADNSEFGQVVYLAEQGSAGQSVLAKTSSEVINNQFSANLYNNNDFLIGDVNGDGKSDLVWVFTIAKYAYRALFLADAAGDRFYHVSTERDEALFNIDSEVTEVRFQLGDLNGDAKADLVWTAKRVNDLSRAVYVSDEFGNHFTRTSYQEDTISSLSIGNHQNAATRLVDLNADGRQDLVYTYTENNTFGWVSFTANINGTTFTQADSGQLSSASNPGFENHHYLFADITADGRSDMVWLFNDQSHDLYQRVYTLPQAYPDHIEKITDGFGTETIIEYAYLSDPSKTIYTRDNTAVYPYREDTGLSHVVENVKRSNGVGGYNEFDYSYAGARTHLTGRGFVGFKEKIETDRQTNFITTERYAQTFPLIGSLESSVTRKSTSGLIRETYSHWRSSNVNWSGTNTQFPHMIDTVTTNYELDGGEISTSLLVNQYDTTDGNIDVSTRTIGYGFSGATGNAYNPNGSFNNSNVSNRQLWVTTTNTYLSSFGTNWRPGFLSRESMRYQSQNDATGKIAVTEYTPMSSNSYLPRTERRFDGSNVWTSNTYGRDSYGNINSITTTAANLTGSINESWGSYINGLYPSSYTNALGHIERYDYDLRTGQRTELEDINGLKSYAKYDDFGRQVVTQANAGALTISGYDNCTSCAPNSRYRVTTTVSHPDEAGAGSPQTVTAYGQFDRELRKSTTGFNGDTILETRAYDNRGRMESRSEPYYVGDAALLNTYSHDDYDRVLVENKADGSRLTYLYQTDAGQANQRSKQTQSYRINIPAGTKTVATQQWTNALSQIARTVDAENILTELQYDSQGNVAWSRVDGQASTIVTVVTDVAGNKTRINDPDAGLIEFDYDGLGRLREQRYVGSDTHKINSDYDQLGRLVTRTDDDDNGNITTATWQYDTAENGIGLVEFAQQQGFTETYVYDAYARPKNITTVINTEPAKQFAFSYDAYDRLTRQISPSGFVADYSYNTNSYLQAITDVNDNNNVIWNMVEQDARNNVSILELGNGLTTVNDYDAATGYMETVTTGTTLTSGEIQNLSFVYDSAGNLYQRNSQRSSENLNESFTYDDLHRLKTSNLTGINSGSRNATFDYDNLGNIKTKSDVSNSDGYSYGNNAGPHAVSSIAFSGSTTKSYAYDFKGNMTQRDNQTIDYTVFNKPEKITGSGFTTEFNYSPERQRYYQKHSNTNNLRESYYYQNRSFEVVKQGSVTREKSYIGKHFTHTKVVDGSSTTEERLYLHRDHLDSVESITDGTGSLVQRLAFDTHGRSLNDAWERPTTAEETQLADLRFTATANAYTGHEQLIDSGLIHMNGRMYDPYAGRFLSADPFVQFPNHSQSYNRYSYVLNNPLSYNDPSGEIIPLVWAGAVLIYKAYNVYDTVTSGVEDFQTLTSDDASFAEKALAAVSLTSAAAGVPKVIRDKGGKVLSVYNKKKNKKRSRNAANNKEQPKSVGSDAKTEKADGNKNNNNLDKGESYELSDKAINNSRKKRRVAREAQRRHGIPTSKPGKNQQGAPRTPRHQTKDGANGEHNSGIVDGVNDTVDDHGLHIEAGDLKMGEPIRKKGLGRGQPRIKGNKSKVEYYEVD